MKRLSPFILGFALCLFLSAHAFAEHAAEAAHGIDWEHGLVYPAANFFILIFFLVLLLRKPLIRGFRERAAGLKLSMNDARTLYDKAYAQHQEIDTKLKNVEVQSRKLMADIQAEAELERKTIVQDAMKMAERIKTDATRIADQEVKRATETLKAEAVRLAMGLAREQVSQRLGDEQQKQLGDEFVSLLKTQGAR